MPRRNLIWLVLISAVSLVCYHKTLGNRYGRILAGVLDHVSRRYYRPIEDGQLFEGAMRGMMSKLDKNSEYYTPAQKKKVDAEINQQFGGVGMNVGLDPKTKQLLVLSPLYGSPAYNAGIRAGDRILKIDGQSTQGMSLDDGVERMHGKPDTEVVLTVLHEGQQQPDDIKIARKIIQVDTVQGDTRGPDGKWQYFLPGHDRIGYVRLTAFAEAEKKSESGKKSKTTVADLHDVLDTLVKQGMRGLVLDLRDNPGGSLRAAIGVCDLFIMPTDRFTPRGVIVTTRGRDGQIRDSYAASGHAPFTGFPMAVLVNGGSASASEIVAACLQDYGRAVVVGQQTYGKGTVQEVGELGEPYGMLKLTIASFWRPSGRNIQRPPADAKNTAWGVLPDEGFQVTVDEDELLRSHRWRQERDVLRAEGKPAAPDTAKPFVDRPLVKAVEYVERMTRK